MTKQEFVRQLAEVLNENPAQVTPETVLEQLAGWDSTGMLGVMAMLDGELQVEIDVDRLRQCKTVQDLVALAGKKIQ
jgi:acyl carrier protein